MNQPLYLGTNRHVVRLDANTGEEAWRVRLPSSSWGSTLSLIVSPDRLYAGLGGRCYALDLATGALQWQNDLPNTGWNPVLLLDFAAAGDDGPACPSCGQSNRSNAAFCCACGTAIRPRARRGRAASDLLLLATNGRVIALDRASGLEVWRCKLTGMGGLVTLVAAGNRLFAGGSGRVHALDRASGEIQWTNGLPRLGYHFVTLAMRGADSTNVGPALAAIQAQQQAAAAGAAGS